MIIDVLVCRPDGTQEVQQREVAEDWFAAPETGKTEIAE